GISADGDIGIAITIEVRHRDKETSGEVRIKGHELEDFLAGMAIEDADIGAARWSRNGDDVRDAGVVDITEGDANASGEVRAISHEGELGLAGSRIPEHNNGPATGIGTGDPVVGSDQCFVTGA